MQGKAHLLSGIAVATITTGFLVGNIPNENILGVTSGIIIGSICLDIDNPKSMLGNKIPLISKIINKMFGHRGFVHTPLNLICLYFLFDYLAQINLDIIKYIILAVDTIFIFKMLKHTKLWYRILITLIYSVLIWFGLQDIKWYFYGILLGSIWHILLDIFTKGGISLLWPFSTKRFSLRKQKSGKDVEYIYVGVLCLMYFALLLILKVG